MQRDAWTAADYDRPGLHRDPDSTSKWDAPTLHQLESHNAVSPDNTFDVELANSTGSLYAQESTSGAIEVSLNIRSSRRHIYLELAACAYSVYKNAYK